MAHQECVPLFVICTNLQFVAVVRRRPESPTLLGHIEGMDPGNVARRAEGLLTALRCPAPVPEAPPVALVQALVEVGS